jgi:predicted Abi (CAAX) family protease
MSAAFVTIRSAARRRLQDLRDALTTIPDWRTWRTCGLVYGLFLIGAFPVGVLSGLVRVDPASLTRNELVGSGLLLFVHPALAEELVFRGLLLPRDGRSWPRGRLLLVVGAALAAYVASHPINALLFRPQVVGLFESTPYLALTTLLGLTCTATYLISRSIWPSVAIHWLTVVTWLWLLGGKALLR